MARHARALSALMALLAATSLALHGCTGGAPDRPVAPPRAADAPPSPDPGAPSRADPDAPAELVAQGGFEPEVRPLPADPDDYAPLPGFAAMDIPEGNPLTPAKAALGRQLYHDPRLSGDGRRSCYSCHVCEKGLADGRPTALGAFDKPLTRNSPTMWNVGYQWSWYWDGRATSLEAQALAAWKGANMGAGDGEAVLAKLNAIPGYERQFQVVFGGPATGERVSEALASHMRTIVGGKTAFDRWQAGDASALSESAQRGWQVFQAKGCNTCHAGALLTDLVFHNVGIGMNALEPDLGRFKVSGDEKDKGAFKTPTLRDVAQSAPYFHDGSVATLDEAVRLMAKGGIDNEWLSRDKLKPQTLSEAELGDLLAFLRSLDEPCEQPAPRLP